MPRSGRSCRREADYAPTTFRLVTSSATVWLELVLVTGLLFSLALALAAAERDARASARSAFHETKLREMDAEIERAVADKKLPGAVLWLEHGTEPYDRAYGQRAVMPAREEMTVDTIFDAASLTKVIATTPAIMRLLEEKKMVLDAPVARYLPDFAQHDKSSITVRHLLTHTSGLPAGLPRQDPWAGYIAGIELACAQRPTAPPGTAFRYSDVNFIVLGELVRRVGGETLDVFCAREIFRPLQMNTTLFNPPARLRARIAPTEQTSSRAVLRGEVHDPTARRMGGVAGHAGLFTTAADLARFSRMLLGGGQLEGTRILQPETVQQMTSVQSDAAVPARRGLGWDIDSPYSGPRGNHFPLGSYGHTGWTGTSLWLDPFSESFLILLSNRNHPTERGSVLALRARVGTLAAQAIRDFNFVYVPGALEPRSDEPRSTPARAGETNTEVLAGIDVLARNDFAELKGLRLGLITNHTGKDRRRRRTIDLLHATPGVQLKVLFSPEHGILGALDAKVADDVDEPTGLRVLSLYGESRKPSTAQLRDLDALVFDIQDIGTRFYTYISTLGLAMEAAADARLKFFVLDRPNPINGVTVEGPLFAGKSMFTAYHALPVRHGMTVGELARLFRAERGWNLDLTVVPVAGWRRRAWWDETALPWTNPSPNMRNLTEAIFYPGIGLLETAVSVGRGTDTPFEVLGAPYIDEQRLVAELGRYALPGVAFVPIEFTPRASVHKDQACRGIYLMLTNRETFRPVDLGLALCQVLYRNHPREFPLEKVQTLLQHQPTLEAIKAGKSPRDIKATWETDLRRFEARRGDALLYR